MKDFYPWDVADLNFPAALEDQSVLSDTLDVVAQNGQMELLATTSSRDAKDATKNPPKRKKSYPYSAATSSLLTRQPLMSVKYL